MISVNPANLEILEHHTPLTQSQILNKINKSYSDYLDWKKVPIDEKSNFLLQIASSLKNNVDYHALLISSEMGKPIREARLEVEKCVWVCQYYAENAPRFLEDRKIKTDASISYVKYDPLGLVFGVMPWNFPYWQVFRFIAPSLMAGNACILKHASNVFGCANAIEKVVIDVVPYKNVFTNLIVSSQAVPEIIQNSKIKAVTLTGSEKAGSEVAMIAGKEIKRSLLELGGSDPFVVLEDADLDKCVPKAIISRFLNTGQSCIAAKRFIVDENIYDDFINRIEIEVKNLVVGDPLDINTQLGPLAKEAFVDELDAQIKGSVDKGARLICGGKRIDKKGYYYEPTLLVDVNETMAAFKQETFGPVLCVIKSKNIEDALRLANNSEYGLSSSVWTSSPEKATYLTSNINSGAVFINDMSKSDPRLPFGGINKSGYGRELSDFGLREFVNVKTVYIK